MESEKIQKIERRRAKVESSSEWTNFKSLIDTSRKYFSPDSAVLESQSNAGSKINKRRVSDIGIGFKNDFVSGVMSEMVTSGENWFEYYVDDAEKNDVDALASISKTTMNSIVYSNFISEFNKFVDGGCTDGTACMYSERYFGEKRVYDCSVSFGNFWFIEDFYGRPDIVWVKKCTTAGGLVSKYGMDGVSEKVREVFKTDPDKEVDIIYYCAPRDKRDSSKKTKDNKAYEFITYEKDGAHPLEEGGTDYQVFTVHRSKRINNETLGRGPCIDTLCTMAAIERKEKDIQRADVMNTRPRLAIPASQGTKSFRFINNDDGSFLIYNDVFGQPPQEFSSAAKLDMSFEILKWKAESMRSMFYLDYFNPLQDRKNMTLGETRERVSKSYQMVSQIVSGIEREGLDRLLQARFYILLDAGAFADVGTPQEIVAKFGGRLKIRYKSRLANAQRRIRLASIREALQDIIGAAQSVPDPTAQFELMATIDSRRIPKEIFEGTNAPMELLRKKSEVDEMVEGFKQSMAQQQQLEAAVKMADASSKGSVAAQPNSLTARVMGQ